jgi:hydroxyethylthiazole kinase-like uncharacterized protein yjeF
MPLRDSINFSANAKKLSNNKADSRPLLFARDVALIDAAAEKLGESGQALMNAAGCAVARQRLQMETNDGRPTLVLAGPGKNGGDGYVAAREIAAAGHRVILLEIETTRRPKDAGAARDAWLADGGTISALSVETLAAALDARPAVIIDALFGVGLVRPLEGAAAEAAALVANARQSGADAPLVIAVDMPSGVSADSGAAPGPAFAADVTVTFVARKPGQFIGAGAQACGEIVVADIGMPDDAWSAVEPICFEISPGLWPHSFDKADDAHKYVHGAAIIASGGFGASGAARLAAEAALRIGAGLVTIASPSGAMAECAAQLTAIMLRDAETPETFGAALADPRIKATALGMGHASHPGGFARTRAFVLAALNGATDRLTVLDADALTAFAEDPETLFAAIGDQPVVLTPHRGEFAKLFPKEAARLVSDMSYGKRAATADAAARAGAVVLLKGADTIVAAPEGRCGLQAATGARAAPWLSTAGSGDVLAGIIAGLGARGFPAFDAACAGAWAHLEAGRICGPGAIAEDLPIALKRVLADAIAGERFR